LESLQQTGPRGKTPAGSTWTNSHRIPRLQRTAVHAGMPQQRAAHAVIPATECVPLTSSYEVIYEVGSGYWHSVFIILKDMRQGKASLLFRLWWHSILCL